MSKRQPGVADAKGKSGYGGGVDDNVPVSNGHTSSTRKDGCEKLKSKADAHGDTKHTKAGR